METYVCLLIDDDRRIVGVDTFTATDAAGAKEKAAANKAANPNARAYELWRRGKKIAPAGELKAPNSPTI